MYAPVAQLDRVFGYEPKGRGFESLPAYQNHIIQIYFTLKTALQLQYIILYNVHTEKRTV